MEVNKQYSVLFNACALAGDYDLFLVPMFYGVNIRTSAMYNADSCVFLMYKPVRNLDSVPGTEANGSSSLCETLLSLCISSISYVSWSSRIFCTINGNRF